MAVAIAGLSSCTTYGTAPVANWPAPAASDGGTGGSGQGLSAKAADIPVGSGKTFPDAYRR